MIQIDAVELPEGLTWVDEYDTQAVAQSLRRRLNGAATVFARALSGGRPITLQAPEDQPITRAQAADLEALASIPGGVYTLTLRDQSFQVMFRHHEPPALALSLLFDYADPTPEDYLVGTLKFVTV